MVATVLTVYGIETPGPPRRRRSLSKLQQYLPFTVLKLETNGKFSSVHLGVATVLTVYGIETAVVRLSTQELKLQQYLPFTVLKLTSYYC